MGMPISLAVRGRHTDDAALAAAWDETVGILKAIDLTFSTYRYDSAISRLGRGELVPADCPPEVTEVLRLAALAEQDTLGAFAVWRRRPDGSLLLDTDGAVKGWAVERASVPLRKLPDTDFCLSAGGDMLCRTADPDGPAWQIGIEDPFDTSRVLAVVPVVNGAVATSGTAHRGQHLVDARTGQAPTGLASVTVIADSLTRADIDATAAYVQGRGAEAWLATRPGRIGFIVRADGSAATVVGPGC
jgi:thiamine biosynthesis lipoprotein